MKEYTGPRSLCSCGHLGDGPNSDHGASDLGTPGHGKCNKCDCKIFSWNKFTNEYQKHLNENKT